jgi:hypothetical protein
MPGTISIEQALIYTMVTMSGVEGPINNTELMEIGHIVKHLPIFKHFDEARLTTVAQEAGEMLQEPEGLNAVLGLIGEALPPKLRETPMRWPSKRADLAVGREELRFSPSCATGSASTSWSPPRSNARPSPAIRWGERGLPRAALPLVFPAFAGMTGVAGTMGLLPQVFRLVRGRG